MAEMSRGRIAADIHGLCSDSERVMTTSQTRQLHSAQPHSGLVGCADGEVFGLGDPACQLEKLLPLLLLGKTANYFLCGRFPVVAE